MRGVYHFLGVLLLAVFGVLLIGLLLQAASGCAHVKSATVAGGATLEPDGGVQGSGSVTVTFGRQRDGGHPDDLPADAP